MTAPLWEILKIPLAARFTVSSVDIREDFGLDRISETFFYEEHLRNERAKSVGI